MTADENSKLKVIFAPDWRDGNPYQQDLGRELIAQGVELHYLDHYRRGFPLTRGLKAYPSDSIFHLHWPNPYLGRSDAWLSWLRAIRFPLDLKWSLAGRPLVITAHNLFPHHSHHSSLIQRAVGKMYRQADRVIAHSQTAAGAIAQQFHIPTEKTRVIRHGLVSDLIHPLPDRMESRQALNLPPHSPLCLMFGAASPYKGIEEVLQYWVQHKPDCDLAIVGKPATEEYGAHLKELATANSRIHLRLDFVTNEELRQWLASSDCCLFNYEKILTSGSVHPPRSLGIPILLPDRLDTLELDEPSPRVIRFRTFAPNFHNQLLQCLDIGCDYDSAADWRESHAWSRIAEQTVELYRELI